jgi:hypothetical protein
MAHSNSMGFLRRVRYGMHREDWKRGERRQIRKHEAEEVILAETSEPERCSECGSLDHTDAEVAIQELDKDIRFWNEED